MRTSLNSKKVALVTFSILALFGLAACGNSPAAQTISTTPPPVITTTPPPTTTAAVVLDGAKLFSSTCAKCHDSNEIAPAISAMAHNDLVAFIKGHLADPLTDAQRSALADYLTANVCDDG